MGRDGKPPRPPPSPSSSEDEEDEGSSSTEPQPQPQPDNATESLELEEDSESKSDSHPNNTAKLSESEEESESGSDPQPRPDHAAKQSESKEESESGSDPQPRPDHATKQSESEEESESGSDPDPRPQPDRAAKQSESEEESESGSDPQPQPDHAAKQSEFDESQSEPGSESDSDSEPAKKSKPAIPNDAPKTQGRFKRIWSYDDEIALLKSLLKYQQSKDRYVSVSMTEMRDFLPLVAKSLSIDVDASKLIRKVRGLKKRYRFACARAKKGQDPHFSKDHDRSIYHLSDKLWGKSLNADGGKTTALPPHKLHRKRKREITALETEAKASKNGYPCLKDAMEKMGNNAIVAALKMLDPDDAAELENKLRLLESEEIKIRSRKMNLFKHILDLAMEALNGSSSD